MWFDQPNFTENPEFRTELPKDIKDTIRSWTHTESLWLQDEFALSKIKEFKSEYPDYTVWHFWDVSDGNEWAFSQALISKDWRAIVIEWKFNIDGNDNSDNRLKVSKGIKVWKSINMENWESRSVYMSTKKWAPIKMMDKFPDWIDSSIFLNIDWELTDVSAPLFATTKDIWSVVLVRNIDGTESDISISSWDSLSNKIQIISPTNPVNTHIPGPDWDYVDYVLVSIGNKWQESMWFIAINYFTNEQ